MTMPLAGIVFLLSLLVARPAELGGATEATDVLATALRHKFAHNGSGLQNKAVAYFITIGDKDSDPSDDLIRRFVPHVPPVRKGSACRHDEGGFVFDRASGKKGLLFRTRDIKWISDIEAVVQIGYYEQGLSADWSTYTLKKDKGRWTVSATKLEMIS
jgi:hypothetical protein